MLETLEQWTEYVRVRGENVQAKARQWRTRAAQLSTDRETEAKRLKQVHKEYTQRMLEQLHREQRATEERRAEKEKERELRKQAKEEMRLLRKQLRLKRQWRSREKKRKLVRSGTLLVRIRQASELMLSEEYVNACLLRELEDKRTSVISRKVGKQSSIGHFRNRTFSMTRLREIHRIVLMPGVTYRASNLSSTWGRTPDLTPFVTAQSTHPTDIIAPSPSVSAPSASPTPSSASLTLSSPISFVSPSSSSPFSSLSSYSPLAQVSEEKEEEHDGDDQDDTETTAQTERGSPSCTAGDAENGLDGRDAAGDGAQREKEGGVGDRKAGSARRAPAPSPLLDFHNFFWKFPVKNADLQCLTLRLAALPSRMHMSKAEKQWDAMVGQGYLISVSSYNNSYMCVLTKLQQYLTDIRACM